MAKSRIHSVLTALPLLMLVGGLYIYYNGEQSQRDGALIMAEAVELNGAYKGLSIVKSGGEGQHYLWLTVDGRSRGVRLDVNSHAVIEAVDPPLSETEALTVSAAPRVEGSRVLWLASLQRGEETLVTLVSQESESPRITESAMPAPSTTNPTPESTQ